MGEKVVEMSLRQEFEKEALSRLFAGLDSHNVRYAVLRNYETLPHSVGARDIDILVLPENLHVAKQVACSIAKDMNLSFANYYVDERLTQFVLVRRDCSGELLDFKLDFFTNSQIYGIEAYSAKQMLEGINRHNGIPVVNEKFIFLDKWLFHVLVGQALHPKYDAKFAAICQGQRDELLVLLTPIFGKSLSQNLLDGVMSGYASSMASLSFFNRLVILIKMLINNGYKGIVHILHFIWHRLRNFVRPKGIFLSVSGPDGCGKTTVIDMVISELKTIYGGDSVVYRHFRPAALPRIADIAKATGAIHSVDQDYSRPHRAKQSGFLGSLVRLGYYLFDYFLGYFRSIRPVLLKRQIMLFDRYYYDMICDPGRSRIGLSFRFLNAVKCFLPLPEYAFFIHVGAEETYRRKQELSLENIKKLNSCYLDLVKQGVLLQVDNEGLVDKAVAEIVDCILKNRDQKIRCLIEKLIK